MCVVYLCSSKKGYLDNKKETNQKKIKCYDFFSLKNDEPLNLQVRKISCFTVENSVNVYLNTHINITQIYIYPVLRWITFFFFNNRLLLYHECVNKNVLVEFKAYKV